MASDWDLDTILAFQREGKRELLMFKGIHENIASFCEDSRRRVFIFNAHTQYNWVCNVSYSILDAGQCAACHGRPNHNVFLSVYRLSSVVRAERHPMNNVTLCFFKSLRNCITSSLGISKVNQSPLVVCTGGRGRSVGRPKTHESHPREFSAKSSIALRLQHLSFPSPQTLLFALMQVRLLVKHFYKAKLEAPFPDICHHRVCQGPSGTMSRDQPSIAI